MKTMLKILAAGAMVAAVSLPAAAQVRVGVHIGAPLVAAPAPAYYYGAPRALHSSYYDNRYDSRYDLRSRREAEWRRREWLRREEWRREARHEQLRREHWHHERGRDHGR